MTDFAPAELPLEIERVHGSRPSAGEIRLALSGVWQGPEQAADHEPLLVIQIEGRRHRFPADADDHAAELPEGRWRATFSMPDWAEPRYEGQAAVWIGNAVVPVPPLHGSHHAPPALASAVPADEHASTAPESQADVEAQPESYEARPVGEGAGLGVIPVMGRPASDPAGPLAFPEAPRSGPLADLLLKETVAALHSELEQRTTEAARLRGALGDARSELDARVATQSQLETTLGELSVELKRLMAAIEEQREELDAHRARAGEEREEFERRLSELAAAHEEQMAELTARHEQREAELTATAEGQAAETSARRAELAAARSELAEIRAAAEGRGEELRRARDDAAIAQARAEQRGAESAALREELAASHVAREAALSEVAGLQAELSRLGAELAVTRERVTNESGDLGQANRLLADAKALAEQLRRERGG